MSKKEIKKVQAYVLTLVMLVGLLGSYGTVQAKIKLNKKSVSVTVGSTVILRVTGTGKKVKWSSSNKKVATVTSKGRVKAKKAGKATITAKVDARKYKCRVVVKAKKKTTKQEKITEQESTTEQASTTVQKNTTEQASTIGQEKATEQASTAEQEKIREQEKITGQDESKEKEQSDEETKPDDVSDQSQGRQENTIEESSTEKETAVGTTEATIERQTEEETTEKQTTQATTEKQTTEATTEQQTTEATTEQQTTEATTEKNSPSKETQNYDAGEYSITLVHNGEGTYYEPEAGGASNLDDFATENSYYTAAMNTYDYMNNMAGAYVEITDKDGDKIKVLITDRLPEGAKGDIDLKPDAFAMIEPHVTGRMNITWKIIPLPTDEPIQYVFKPTSTQYWAEIQVRNHRYPIAKLEYLDASTNTYVELPRQEYNYFTAESGMGSPGPYTFRVTDIYGHQLVDTGIAINKSAPVDGAANFPY